MTSQENRRDRFGFYGLELILPLVTSQQSNKKKNYSHKWLNWVTKTKKPNSIIYTHTSYHTSGILKDNYPMSHKTHKCTH